MEIIRKTIRWFQAHIQEHRLDSTAAHGAYFIIISFLPFIAVLLTLLKMIHFPGLEIDGISLMDQALSFFPESVAMYLQGLLAESTPLSGILSISVITFLWSASSGMLAIIKGLDAIYEVKETRGYFHLRLISMVYLLIFAIALVITAVTQVFGSLILKQVQEVLPKPLAEIILQFKSLAGLVLLILFFCIMFTAIPRKSARFRSNFAGALFSATGWVLFSYFFSIFVENFSNYSVVYGSLATLVILMLWLFSCMYIMFLGAEVAMWLEKARPQDDFRVWRASRRDRNRKAEEKRNTTATRVPENDADAQEASKK